MNIIYYLKWMKVFEEDKKNKHKKIHWHKLINMKLERVNEWMIWNKEKTRKSNGAYKENGAHISLYR